MVDQKVEWTASLTATHWAVRKAREMAVNWVGMTVVKEVLQKVALMVEMMV